MIIYQDEYIVAINKPAGLLVHASLIDKHETQNALQILRNFLGRVVYPVHRLDKPTSGVLVFGLSSDSAKKLSEAFMNRDVEKKYLGLVRGFTEEFGVINHPLKDLWDKMTDKKKSKLQEAREAITEYRLLEKIELNEFNVFKKKIKVSKAHKLLTTLKHWAFARIFLKKKLNAS